jgi:hypothetical protein
LPLVPLVWYRELVDAVKRSRNLGHQSDNNYYRYLGRPILRSFGVRRLAVIGEDSPGTGGVEHPIEAPVLHEFGGGANTQRRLLSGRRQIHSLPSGLRAREEGNLLSRIKLKARVKKPVRQVGRDHGPAP